jgi:hypothetical protein
VKDPHPTCDLGPSISKKLARYEIDERTVTAIVKRISKTGLELTKLDFCPYGICLDYFGKDKAAIVQLLDSEKLRVAKLFPYGVPVDDLYHLHVEMEIPELVGRGIRG